MYVLPVLYWHYRIFDGISRDLINGYQWAELIYNYPLVVLWKIWICSWSMITKLVNIYYLVNSFGLLNGSDNYSIHGANDSTCNWHGVIQWWAKGIHIPYNYHVEPVVVPTFIQNFPAAHDSYRVPKQDRSRPISPRFWVWDWIWPFGIVLGFRCFFLVVTMGRFTHGINQKNNGEQTKICLLFGSVWVGNGMEWITLDKYSGRIGFWMGINS